MSEASTKREEGNRFYRDALEIKYELIKLDRLMRASKLYAEALIISTSPEDVSAIQKNLALVKTKLAPMQAKAKAVASMYVEGLNHSQLALKAGLGRGEAWLTSMRKFQGETLSELLKSQTSKQPKTHVKNLRLYSRKLERDWIYSRMNMEAAKVLLMVSNSLIDICDFKGAQLLLVDCLTAVQEATNHSEPDGQVECQEVLNTINSKKALCEARVILQTADEEAAKATAVTRINLIEEQYRIAMMLAQNICKNTEALAATRLGLALVKAKLSDKAIECFTLALSIANASKGKELTSTPWYADAFKGLETLQREQHKVSQASFDRLKEQFKTTHSHEIEQLKLKSDVGGEKLLQFIYNKWPPKETTYILPAVNATNMKAVVRKALIHYHSDKQTRYDPEWQFICAEISKCLASKLEMLNKSG